MYVSVVTIALHKNQNDWRKIKKTVSSLADQNGIDELVLCVWDEVGDLERKMEEISVPFKVKLAKPPRPGFSVQRNTGVKNASGKIIVFADDDMTFEKDCIRKLVSSLSEDKIAVCGLVLPEPTESIVGICQQIFLHPGGGWNLLKIAQSSEDNLVEIPYAHTTLMASEKSILEKVGFDENLVWGSEDTDFSIRAKKMFPDRKIYLVPSAVAFHPPRESFAELLRWMFRYGRSREDINIKHKIPPFSPILPKLAIVTFAFALMLKFAPTLALTFATASYIGATAYLLKKYEFEFEKSTENLLFRDRMKAVLLALPIFVTMSCAFDVGRITERLHIKIKDAMRNSGP